MVRITHLKEVRIVRTCAGDNTIYKKDDNREIRLCEFNLHYFNRRRMCGFKRSSMGIHI